jgi:TIR domain
MAHDVFISYAAEDKTAAEAVCNSLERRQIRCWIAPRDARPGLDYADSIVDALDEAPVMVFVVSSRSIASPHVKREVEHAANTGTSVIPFRIEDVELSRGLRYFLGTVHWIDALTPPIDKQLEYLVDTVQYFLDRRRAAQTGSSAAREEPAPRPVTSPNIPPRDDAAPPASVERSSVAGTPSTAPSAATAPEPAPQFLAPAAARADSSARSSAPNATSAESATPSAAEQASAGPPTSSPVRLEQTRRADSDAPSPAKQAVPGPADHAEGPPAFRPATRDALWDVVGFGTIGAALGGLLGFGVFVAIFGTDAKIFMYAMAFAFMTIVPAAVVTRGWLYAVRQGAPSPAMVGGLGGLLGGALSGAISGTAFDAALPPGFVTAQALQWATFGIAGGLAASRGRSVRPAVSVSIALIGVCFVRTLILSVTLPPRDRENIFAFVLLDFLIAIGWGLGLIACPATTAALRQPQTAGSTSIPGGAPSNPRA